MVRAGGVYIPSRTLGDFQNGHAAGDAGGLTPRQLDVLQNLVILPIPHVSSFFLYVRLDPPVFALTSLATRS